MRAEGARSSGKGSYLLVMNLFFSCLSSDFKFMLELARGKFSAKKMSNKDESMRISGNNTLLDLIALPFQPGWNRR
jgi:hypothetical protein